MADNDRYQVRRSDVAEGKFIVSDTTTKTLVRDADDAIHLTERDAHDLAQEYRYS